MSALYVLVNGKLVKSDEASLLVSDLSIQRGFGIFDFFKMLGGKPIFMDAHLDRFFRSAEAMRLPLDMGREALKELIFTLTDANGIADSGIRLTLTGGYSKDGYTPAAPNLVITQQALTIADPALSPGIRLITHAHQRQMPEVKTIDYLMAIWLQPSIRAQGADDVLYHQDGVVTECPRSNFFIVTEGDVVLTPGRNILAGITRAKLLELSTGKIEERDITLADIRSAKEAFITSTTKYLVPVVGVDGQAIGDGRPGPVWSELLRRLLAATAAEVD